ncbi:hypothetical protein Nepgr_021796 [Nepenthes gracilis]|uniref:Uncharacterized protein n=1 Tax=Nepenthes gracilis TaxID=150966 RepID=A0AAD3SY42_NEPGR|nr:hypothetical protein Nepgr_021796 [Nepenthes gracilis]
MEPVDDPQAELEEQALGPPLAPDKPAAGELFEAVDLSAELTEGIVVETLAERAEEAAAPSPPPSSPRSQSRPEVQVMGVVSKGLRQRDLVIQDHEEGIA